MLQPTKVGRIAAIGLFVASATLIGACAGEVTGPGAASLESKSMFVPTDAAKALIGVADGVYTKSFDPKDGMSMPLGPNMIDIPAGAVCSLTSTYGPGHWNETCDRETQPITLVVTIKNATSARPSITFSPAMRFSPDKDVQLSMYAPKVRKDDAKNWLMFYCPDKGACVDESLTDPTLMTNIDHAAKMLHRRVKHFSGYTVAERSADGLLPDGL